MCTHLTKDPVPEIHKARTELAHILSALSVRACTPDCMLARLHLQWHHLLPTDQDLCVCWGCLYALTNPSRAHGIVQGLFPKWITSPQK